MYIMKRLDLALGSSHSQSQVAAQNYISALKKCYSKGELEERNWHCASPHLWVPATTAITLGSLKALWLGLREGHGKGNHKKEQTASHRHCEQVSTSALGWLAGENRWSQLFRLGHECAHVASEQQLPGGIPTVE